MTSSGIFFRFTICSLDSDYLRRNRWLPRFSTSLPTVIMAAQLPIPVFTSLDQAIPDLQTAAVQACVHCVQRTPTTPELTRHASACGTTNLLKSLRNDLDTSHHISPVHQEESSTFAVMLHCTTYLDVPFCAA